MIITNSKRLSDVDQQQSTPTKNFARGFFKGEYESGILNLSNILSSYSCYTGSTAGAFDPGILQENINEYQQRQNRKLNEMLSDVRVQLNVAEEQNGKLQNDMERITKQLNINICNCVETEFVRNINRDLDLIQCQEELPDEVLSTFGYATVHQPVLQPMRVIVI